MALGQRPQDDKYETPVGLAPAGKGADALDRRVVTDDIDELRQFFFHQLEGDALVGLDAAEHQSDILSGEEALWDDPDQIAPQAQCHKQAQHDDPWPLQGATKTPLIKAEYRLEGALADSVQPAGL